MAGQGHVAGSFHVQQGSTQVPVIVQLASTQRQRLEQMLQMTVPGMRGPVPLSELVRVQEGHENAPIFHKNLMPVSYVFGDLAGVIESPVYALSALNKKLDRLKGTAGQPVARLGLAHPENTENLVMKWDGEWHITLEVFRDLGLAFAAVLVLIYILMVGWFRSFLTPLVVMVAIPFSLVGILPAHGALHAFFTATSMIGFMAGAGIVVRNSIILVDFIEQRIQEGMPLAEAVVDAGAVRFRPMLLTALAVVVGAGVILFDPIFQGLAISLMAGEVASLLISRMAVPVLYYMAQARAARR
jgi:multidrug efflux pump subunit AcrB